MRRQCSLTHDVALEQASQDAGSAVSSREGGDVQLYLAKTFANYDGEVAMATKGLIFGFALITLLAVASPAISQQVPPPSAQAKQTEALVNKAAELIDKNGKAAFTEFRRKDS